MRIYVTHCSAMKDEELKDTDEKVTPDRLYTATPTQRFMNRCRQKGVKWAIFSDKYGIWFPHVRRRWYEKDPDDVTFGEFRKLVRDFDRDLRDYGEIHFYYNPGRFHPLYKCLLGQATLRDKIVPFTHLDEIA